MATQIQTQTREGTTVWQLDPGHSIAGFSGKHMMVSTVRGRFTGVAGTIEFDQANPANSRVEVEIDAATLTSGAQQRDDHLKSADFLDVEAYPTIAFKSTRVEPRGPDEAVVHGDLTIRGVTRPVALQAQLNGIGKSPWGQEVAGFEATTTINRKDWGLGWNVALEAGGLLVSEQIKIELDVEAVRQ